MANLHNFWWNGLFARVKNSGTVPCAGFVLRANTLSTVQDGPRPNGPFYDFYFGPQLPLAATVNSGVVNDGIVATTAGYGVVLAATAALFSQQAVTPPPNRPITFTLPQQSPELPFFDIYEPFAQVQQLSPFIVRQLRTDPQQSPELPFAYIRQLFTQTLQLSPFIIRQLHTEPQQSPEFYPASHYGPFTGAEQLEPFIIRQLHTEQQWAESQQAQFQKALVWQLIPPTLKTLKTEPQQNALELSGSLTWQMAHVPPSKVPPIKMLLTQQELPRDGHAFVQTNTIVLPQVAPIFSYAKVTITSFQTTVTTDVC